MARSATVAVVRSRRPERSRVDAITPAAANVAASGSQRVRMLSRTASAGTPTRSITRPRPSATTGNASASTPARRASVRIALHCAVPARYGFDLDHGVVGRRCVRLAGSWVLGQLGELHELLVPAQRDIDRRRE